MKQTINCRLQYTQTKHILSNFSIKMEDFYAKIRHRISLQTHLFVKNKECIIWDGYRKPNTGYGVIRFRDLTDTVYTKHKTRGVHRVCLMVSPDIEKMNIAASLTASHLCGNSLCVNSKHLTFESQGVNNNRMGCFNNQMCIGHGVDRPACLVNLYDETKSYLMEPEGK